MQVAYKLNEPRYYAFCWDEEGVEKVREFELGQAEAYGEAMFWLHMGYHIGVARWDGEKFATYENYSPADL